jgi:hypothetical protein
MSDKMVPIQFPPNLIEMTEAWMTSNEPNVGWCILCNRPIKSEEDLIPETNTHDCAEGRLFEATETRILRTIALREPSGGSHAHGPPSWL